MEKKVALIISILITLLLISNYLALELIGKRSQSREVILVSRVIDGDTIESSEGTRIRLTNINSPEKGEEGWALSKDFLIQFENKTLEIEKISTDKYGRLLARVFSEDYINLLLVEQGFSRKFLVDTNEKSQFYLSERRAIESGRGIWNHSVNYGCISSEIDKYEEFFTITSLCNNLNLKDWTAKDESTKKFKFPEITLSNGESRKVYSGTSNISQDLSWGLSQNVWNNDADTLYIFDEKSKIVHYHSYGY